MLFIDWPSFSVVIWSECPDLPAVTKRQTNTGQRFIFFNLVTFVSWQFLWLWFTLTTFGHLHRWECCNPQELHDFQFSIYCSRSLLICLSVLRNERHIPNQDKFQFPYSLEATPYSHLVGYARLHPNLCGKLPVGRKSLQFYNDFIDWWSRANISQLEV